MSDLTRQEIQRRAEQDARTGRYSSDAPAAASLRGYGCGSSQSAAYVEAFRREQAKRSEDKRK